jgi:outer membrane protein TolC
MALEALQNNLQLHLLNAQRAQADAQLSNAKSGAIPWLNFVEVGYRTGSEEWELEVGVEIPIFTLSGTEKKLSYEALSRRNIEIETLRQSMKFTVRSAAQTYNKTITEWTTLQKQQGELIKKTEQYLKKTTPANPQQMDDQLSLKEKMIQAKFKLLNLRRKINQAKINLIILLGKTT